VSVACRVDPLLLKANREHAAAYRVRRLFEARARRALHQAETDVGGSSGSLALPRDGQLPPALDCHEAEPEADSRPDNRDRGSADLKQAPNHDHGPAGQGSDRVYVTA
jgi:hypothetical protein